MYCNVNLIDGQKCCPSAFMNRDLWYCAGMTALYRHGGAAAKLLY